MKSTEELSLLGHREVIQMTPSDSFIVFDRTKELFDYPIHYHPEFELNYIRNGAGLRRIVGDHMEEIDQAELVLIGPNLSHCWQQYKCSNDTIHEITIQFPDNLLTDSLLNRAIMKPIKDMFRRSSYGILFSQQTIQQQEERICQVTQLDGIDYFLELLSILYDLATSRNQRLLSSQILDPEVRLPNEKMAKLHHFIEQNYSRKITLQEVSALLNMSPVTFNRFIKKRTGKTFIEYLNEIRIGHATRLLINKDMSISEIAFSVGFNSMANFNRIFKKSKNCTPSQYREDFLGVRRFL